MEKSHEIHEEKSWDSPWRDSSGIQRLIANIKDADECFLNLWFDEKD